MPTKEDIMDALEPVVDPEMGFSIVELGLIYDVFYEADEERVHVKMTLTSPACPVGPQIMAMVSNQASQLPDVEDVDIELVWTPPWDPRKHASDDVKAAMGIWDF